MSVGSFIGPDPPYPVGTIVIWTGKLADIPEGWLVCDGNNGTPNLQDRFIRGVKDGSTNPGATGGTNSLSLATGQLPSHSHSASTGTTDGAHTHKVVSSDETDTGYNENAEGAYPETDQPTTQDGSHSHDLDLASTGGGSSIDNQPPHHELVFLQRNE